VGVAFRDSARLGVLINASMATEESSCLFINILR
jgi:hypothetical protein